MMVECVAFQVMYVMPMSIYAQMRRGLALAHVLCSRTQEAVSQVYDVFAVTIKVVEDLEYLVGLFALECLSGD